MISISHPQLIIRQTMVDKRLDYHALNEAWRSTAEPITAITWERLNTKREANEALFETDNVVTVTSRDYPTTSYSYIIHDEDDYDNDDAIIDFASNRIGREYTDRHPSSSDSSSSNGVQRKDMDQSKFNQSIHSPINTTASKYLFNVAFAGGGINGGHVDIKATYRHQISLRIDEESCTLNLDCFEYKPTCLDILSEGEDPPPTRGEENAYFNLIQTAGRGDLNEDDPSLLVEGRDYSNDWGSSSGRDFTLTHYKALCAKFLNSRVFRLRIALSNVKGIRLMAKPIDINQRRDPRENDNDIAAVLILEIADPLGEGSFAVRTVRSRRNNDDAFALCPDWLPGDDTGSKATRFYFYGSLNEMRQTAGYIAKLCPKLARMFEAKESNSLALAPGVISVDYASAPSHNSNNMADVSSNVTYDKPFPPVSAWNGTNDRVREVFEKFLAREENPMKRMMLRMMADPESLVRINQDPNSSPEDIMLSTMMGQQFLRSGGTDGMVDMLNDARENGEECTIS